MASQKKQIPEPAKATEPSLDRSASAPEQQHGPMLVERQAASVPAGNAAPPAARAAELVENSAEIEPPKRAQLSRAVQRQLGNQRSTQLLRAASAQLPVSSPNDRYEREADDVAARVDSGQEVASISRAASMPLRRMPDATEVTPAMEVSVASNDAGGAARSQTASDRGGTMRDATIASRIALAGEGQPLPGTVQAEMESALEADFSSVRVHDTPGDRAAAESLGAEAFTYGDHIWMGPGAAASDRKLMAHELAHVVQQSGEGAAPVLARQTAEAAQTPASTAAPQSAPPTATAPPNAELDAALQQVPVELNEVTPLVMKLIADATGNPKERALNEYRYTDARLQADAQYLRDLLPFAGDRSSHLAAAIAQIEMLRQLLAPALAAATKWHDDHPCGQSVEMWNEEVGTDLAGKGLAGYEEGGLGYLSGTAAYAGSLGIAFLDAAERLLSLGVHEVATAVSKAYTAGDISWNEGERVFDQAALRALLTAAVTRGAGMATSRLGTATARALRLAPTAASSALVSGAVSGGLTAAAALSTQALYTKLLEGAFNSAPARAIWSRGVPSGTEWAIAIPLGMLFGSAGAVNALNKANAKLIGQTVGTPQGPMEIVKITGNGQVLLKPKGSALVPVDPAASGAVMSYDGATRSWRLTPSQPPSSAAVGEQPGVKPPVSSGSASEGTSALAPAVKTPPAAPPAVQAPPHQRAIETPAAKPRVVTEIPAVKPGVTTQTPAGKGGVTSESPAAKAGATKETPAATKQAIEKQALETKPQAQTQAPVATPEAAKMGPGSVRAIDRLAAAREALAKAQQSTAEAGSKATAARSDFDQAQQMAKEYGSAAATPGTAARPTALANAERLDGPLTPVGGVPKDVTTGTVMNPKDVWRADHIVSRSEISADPRMLRLSPAQQEIMWHGIPENFLPLTEAANSSKGGLTVAEWIALRQSKGQPLPKQMADALRDADVAARAAVDKMFKQLLSQ